MSNISSTSSPNSSFSSTPTSVPKSFTNNATPLPPKAPINNATPLPPKTQKNEPTSSLKKDDPLVPKNEGPLAPNVLKEDVIRVLKTCFDPEIPVNIYELGLIYEVKVDENHFVHIRMTLTTPHCPAAESLPAEVNNKVKNLYGISGVKVDVVWEPIWTKEMMSEAAQLQLGLL